MSMPKPSVIRCVLLDLDGTMLDTAPDLVDACNAALASHGFSLQNPAALKPFISGGAAAMLRNAQPELDSERFALLLDSMLEIYQENVAVRTGFFDGMDVVLDELDRRAIPWGIVTNKYRRFTEPLVAALDLAPRTPCIISGDSLSEKKPHPLPLLEASRLLAVSPASSVYIGDARRDIEAGRNAGMYTLAAAYGYVSESDPAAAWGADALIHRPSEIIDWLDRQV